MILARRGLSSVSPRAISHLVYAGPVLELIPFHSLCKGTGLTQAGKGTYLVKQVREGNQNMCHPINYGTL